jgi:branched-chain amino acid transport system substrate-binding protein
MKHRISALFLGTALALAAGSAVAQDKTVKIGVLTDNSGLYSDLGGAGSTVAAQMAVEDSGLAAKGWKIDIVSADHQNKPDIGTTVARQWIDVDKVDIFVDVLNSGVALAVNNLVKEKNAIMINTGAATSDLTNTQCSTNTIHWVYDTYMLANSTGQALVKAGGDTWYFLTADYAFGHALERDTSAVVVKSGGKVIGTVRHPLNSSDFSSFLLQAQSSKAKVVGLANAGGDTINAIKQAAELGLTRSGCQKLSPRLAFVTDIDSVFNFRGGPNLRNRVAHGLVGQWEPHSDDAIYACWLIFQLCCIPLHGQWEELARLFAFAQGAGELDTEA